MTDPSPLTRAFELIESDRLDDARAILQRLLANDQDNADAWWLYAHAVSDVENARRALENVRRLDPTYPGLTELTTALSGPPSAPSESRQPIRSLGQSVAPPPSLPDELAADMDEFDAWGQGDYEIGDLEGEPAEPSRPRSRRRIAPLLVVVLLVVIVVIIAVVVLRQPGSKQANPTPTAGAQVAQATTVVPTASPTIEMTPTSEILPTNTPTSEALPSPSGPDLTNFYSALSGFTVPENGVEIVQTALGDTVIVTVCAERSALIEVMGIVARTAAASPGSLDGVGVQIGDCESEGSMRTIGSTIADATAFANGVLSDQEFQRTWQPLG